MDDMQVQLFLDVETNGEEIEISPINSPLPSPLPSPVPRVPATRVKAYPDASKGPFVVFFRPIKKPLNIIQIGKDLAKQFAAVTEITKVRPNKLRVVVSSS